MTREEFESILEECFIEGYNSALEDIQEDILDEEAFDLEGDYDYYSEDTHPRTLRGTGQHNLPKGALGALKKSIRAHRIEDRLAKRISKPDIVFNKSKWNPMYYKFAKSADKARKAANDYIEKANIDKPSKEEIKDFKNPIKRIISKKGLKAGYRDKIMGPLGFTGYDLD